MRLCIAINFNSNTRSQLINLCNELCEKSERGNFTAPENLHLTFAFLGECDLKQTAAAKSILSAIRFEPFDIIMFQT